jgi:hypothetical protein
MRKDDGLGCNIRPDTIYKHVYYITIGLLFAVVAPCLMALFGMMTIYNTRHVRTLPVQITRHRRTETQLTAMLLVQVGTYVVLNLPICVIHIMRFLPFTFLYTPQFNFTGILFRILNFFFYFTYLVIYCFGESVSRRTQSFDQENCAISNYQSSSTNCINIETIQIQHYEH